MKEKMYITSSLLVLAGLVLITWGLERSPLLWMAGLALVALSMLISFLTHWAPGRKKDEGG